MSEVVFWERATQKLNSIFGKAHQISPEWWYVKHAATHKWIPNQTHGK